MLRRHYPLVSGQFAPALVVLLLLLFHGNLCSNPWTISFSFIIINIIRPSSPGLLLIPFFCNLIILVHEFAIEVHMSFKTHGLWGIRNPVTDLSPIRLPALCVFTSFVICV